MHITPKNIDFSKLPDKAPDYDLKDLLEASCHFGHHKNKWNPDMEPYIYTEKDGIHIFDLATTAKQLQQAYNYVYKLGQQNKSLIMVGTKRQARQIIKDKAEAAGCLYITSRWLGGFLTNWNQVKQSLQKMEKMEDKMEEGEYDAYTKYEQAQFKKEIARLRRFFDGLRGLKTLPDALFIVDPVREDIAVKEARMMDVPVVALIDSNGSPQDIDLPIPANDDAIKSIEFMVQQIGAAYSAGQAGE
jgi:small subunit ribosomal protein S2